MAMFDIGEDFYDTEPDAAMERVFGLAGLQNQNYAGWLRGRLNPYQSEWKSILPDQPNLSFFQFLKGKNPQNQFNALAPQQRGENNNAFAPRTVWRTQRY